MCRKHERPTVHCHHRRIQILLYVSGSLDQDETRELVAHLNTGCRECDEYLAEARAVVDQLPLPLAAPNPQLKQRLLERIQSGSHDDPPLQSPDHETPAHPLALPSQPAWLKRWQRPLEMVVVAVIFLMLGIAIAFPHSEQQRRHIAKLQAQVRSLENDRGMTASPKATQPTGLIEYTRNVVAALKSQDLQIVSFQGDDTGNSSKAWARLLWDRQKRTCYIFAPALERTAPEHRFKLWLVTTSGQDFDAGSFKLDKSGQGRVEIDLPDDLDPIARAHIAYASDKTGSEGKYKPILSASMP